MRNSFILFIYRIVQLCAIKYLINVYGTENISIAADIFSHIDSSLENHVFLSTLYKQLTSNIKFHAHLKIYYIEFSLNNIFFNRMKKLIVSHFSKKGELIVELNKPIEVK